MSARVSFHSGFAVLGLAGVALFAGCSRPAPERPMIEVTAARPLPTENGIDLSLELIGGALFLKPLPTDAIDLYRAVLAHDLPELAPKIEEKSVEGRIALHFGHGKYESSMGRARNEWRIDWSPQRVTRLTLNMMNGVAELDLGGLELERAEIRVDQGRVQLDFGNATPKRSCEVVAEIGTGQLAVRFPPNVGVRVRARKAVGGVQIEGLREVGEAWVNDLYESHAVKLDFALGAGFGEVVVEPKQ